MLVVKCGGATGVDLAAIANDVASLVRTGRKVVVVHGGSAEANQMGESLRHPPRFLTSAGGVKSRYTDPATLEILTMAMAGKINPSLVAMLQLLGVQAVGLTGVDGALIQAQRKPAVKAMLDGRMQVVRDDLTGKITGVNTDLLHLLLGNGYVPVISPPAIDPGQGVLNVDADRTAAAIAAALGAQDLVMLSNVPGVLRDVADPASLVEAVPAGGLDAVMELAAGRMKVKLTAATEALKGGVKRVVLGDGRLPQPVQQALNGRGTVLEPVSLAEG